MINKFKTTVKRFIILIFITMLSQNYASAQDYQISFAGSGETTLVEIVEVQNLTQATSLTLNGTDVLHLVGFVGAEQLHSNANSSLKIYPNPMATFSNIEFELSQACLVSIDLFDISGKKVISTQNSLQAGIQTFYLNGLNSGIYTLSINSENFNYSGKIISNCTTSGIANITYVNSTIKSNESDLKTIANIIQMQYDEGDRILIKAVSGIYSTVTTFIPTASTTITSNFVAATDFDGNNYTTVTIGAQTWMLENLKVTHFRNGENIPNVTNGAAWIALSTGAYCWFNNDITNKDTYGALYNWFTVDDSRNLAPEGWHLPTDEEYTILTTHLGGESQAGSKMKETGTTHWNNPNTGATNECGFTAIPGGSRDNEDGLFYLLGVNDVYWTSSESTETKAWYRYLKYNETYCIKGDYDKGDGFCIRCVKD